MLKSFKFQLPVKVASVRAKEPRTIARLALGALLLANLAAAYAVFRPLGGSAEELEDQLIGLRQQLLQRQGQIGRTRALVAKIEQARSSGDQFLNVYFLNRQTAYSTLLTELDKAAKDAGIRPKDRAFAIDPIEGSENMSMMTITANYEGTYGDLMQFVNRLDKSPRFLILDTLSAAPVQGAGTLNVAVKLNTFVKADPMTQAFAGVL